MENLNGGEVKLCPNCDSVLKSTDSGYCKKCGINLKQAPDSPSNIIRKQNPELCCPLCGSMCIDFSKTPYGQLCPKNKIDDLALSFMKRHDEKYPPEENIYESVDAFCSNCHNKWEVSEKASSKRFDTYRKKTVFSALGTGTAFITVLLVLVFSIKGAVEAPKSNSIMSDSSPAVVTQEESSNIDDFIQSVNSIFDDESDAVNTAETDEELTVTTAESTTEVVTDPVEDLTATENTSGEKNSSTVWIPTHGGKKYHSSSSCSGMKDPEEVQKSEAIERGFSQCGKCWKSYN